MNTWVKERKTTKLGSNCTKRAMTVIATGALRARCLLLCSLWLQSCQGLRGCRLPTHTFQQSGEDSVQVFQEGATKVRWKNTTTIKQNPRAGWTGAGGRPCKGRLTTVRATSWLKSKAVRRNQGKCRLARGHFIDAPTKWIRNLSCVNIQQT